MPYKMFLLKIAVLAAMVWVSLDTSALSQENPFKRMGAELSKEDIELLKRAAAKLYEPDSVQVGTTEAWANSDSGNSGIVTMIKIFEKQGMPCRQLQHEVRVSGKSDPSGVGFTRCKTTEGDWKLLF